jgi:hypothetical protein
MRTHVTPAPGVRRAICRAVVLVACFIPAVWAATVSTHAFGRYEIVLQEGAPFGRNEMFGMVRRQTGLPEYPLMLGWQTNLLEVNIVGPGNRPIALASAKLATPTGSRAATAPFLIERSSREGDTLRLWVRRVGSPGRATFAIDLRALERRLEGER